ncbi:MAG: hypothetical protein HZB46_09530, partial [Solirubrobacterales bacterium]|nr:hypothetical protein [Solirubrobacterales bacterium]
LRPDGSRAARLRGAAAVAQVARPAGGSWRLRVTGGKAAHVAVAVRPLSLVQRAPATATWPQGRELRPEAWAPTAWSAARAGGAVTLTATLRDARGRETSRPLLPAAAGLFVARRGLVTDVAGASSIQLALRRDGRVLARTRPAPLQIVPVPYFVIANDDVPSRRSLRVPMLLMLRGRPVDARRALADDPAGIATASAVAAGRNLDDVRVRWRGGARFEVVSADELRDDERVRLTVHLGARDRRGGEVVNAATASIRARRTTGAAWADRLHTGVRIVLGVVLVALCAYCLWLLTRPRMTGRVQMGGVRITVHGRFPVACRDGGARCWLFGVRGQGVVVRRGLLPLPWGTRPAPLSSRQFSSSRPGRTNPTRRS